MELIISPWVMTAIISGGIFIVSFLLGKSYGRLEKDIIIEEVIKMLCNEGYVKYRHLPDGDIELFKLDDATNS